jgi:hypothetical protein
MSVASVAQLLQEQGGGSGGGGIDTVVDGDGIIASIVGSTLNIANSGVINLTQGSNITLTGTNDNITINSISPYKIGYVLRTFGPATVQPQMQYRNTFQIAGFTPNANTIITATNNSSDSSIPISFTVRYNTGVPIPPAGGFIIEVSNFSDADLVDLTFPFSVIAINP